MNESELGLCSLKTEYRDQSNILNIYLIEVKTSEVARLVDISFGYKQAIINLPEYATLCIGMSANPQEARQSG